MEYQDGGVRVDEWRDRADIFPALADEIAYRCMQQLYYRERRDDRQYEQWCGEEAMLNFEGLVECYAAVHTALLEAQEWEGVARDNRRERSQPTR